MEETLTYCRKEKGIEVFAYCFMPSHVHFVFRTNNEDPSGLLRDFKGFTAKKTMKAIEENPKDPSLKVRIGEAKQKRVPFVDDRKSR